MERIRYFADVSIRRGCGFALVGIWTATVGMAFDPTLAVRAAALMLTLMGVILVAKGHRAPVRNYRRTELWVLLDKRCGLPPERAQAVLGGVLKDRYLWHADMTLIFALVLWAVALLMGLAH